MRQIQKYITKCRFFTGVNNFLGVQNNKVKTNVMNKLNKHRKASCNSTIQFLNCDTKFTHNLLLMRVDSLTYICLHGLKNKQITVYDYATCWVPYTKNHCSTYIYIYMYTFI